MIFFTDKASVGLYKMFRWAIMKALEDGSLNEAKVVVAGREAWRDLVQEGEIVLEKAGV